MSNELEPGAKAPQFSGEDQNNNTIKLEDFKGKKLLLYFYPKDSTPGCTKEACNLRDNLEELRNQGISVVGVSTDSVASHQKFTTKYNLNFPLIADTEKQIVKDYNAWGEKSMFGKKYHGTKRISYLIDEEGKIMYIFSKVKTGSHAQQVLAAAN